MNDFISALKFVLTNKLVIIATIVCILMMNFAGYVSKYRKKPPKQKFKKSVSAPAPAPEPDAGSDGGDDEDYGE